MIPDQTFHCPYCGAPGQVKGGETEYACQCRFTAVFRQITAPAPVQPQQPWENPITWGDTTVAPSMPVRYDVTC